MTFILNGEKREFSSENISYNDILTLMGYKTMVNLSVVVDYPRVKIGEKGRQGGILHCGDSVPFVEGMRITAMNTGNA